jgi:hypothetical protein
MRLPEAYYQLLTALDKHLPVLRPAQRRGLALWVFGALLAGRATETAVVLALSVYATASAVRQRLREWLRDGDDKVKPCHTQVEVERCFAPLLRWLLSWWKEPQLALALDATLDRTRHAALVVSVLYRGCAIPVAWAILPANTKGAWKPYLPRLLRLLWRAVPREMSVLVLVDRGLWSPAVWRRVCRLGWHPLCRLRNRTVWMPEGRRRRNARTLVPGPGHAYVGWGRAHDYGGKRQWGTLLVVWDHGEDEPWVLLTNLRPEQVGLGWYGLRMWIEVGFKALKSLAWEWEKTRRSDPVRVSRFFLVVSVATLWTLATGTRVEDAQRAKLPPARCRRPVGPPPEQPKRQSSVFCQGLAWLKHLAHRGRLWTQLWLWPEPWPKPPHGLQLVMAL